jgi:hypothetical protein
MTSFLGSEISQHPDSANLHTDNNEEVNSIINTVLLSEEKQMKAMTNLSLLEKPDKEKLLMQKD